MQESSNSSTSKSLSKSSIYSLGWEYVSVISRALLQIVVLGVLSRLLAPEDFGIIGIALIFVGLADLFSQFGVSSVLIQRDKINEYHIRVGLSLSLIFGILIIVLLWLTAPLVASFFQNSRVVGTIRGISFSFLFASFGNISRGLLMRNMQFRKLMLANVGSYLGGYAAVGILMAFLGFGVWSLVAAKLAQSLLSAVLTYVFSQHPLRPLIRAAEARELLFYGGGFTLVRVLNYAANQGDYLVVGRMTDAYSLGVYTRAYQLMLLPATYIGQVLQRISFPLMSKLQARPRSIATVYLMSIASINIVTIPAGAFLVILAPEIIGIVLGQQWAEAVLPFQILACGLWLRTSYKVDDSLAKAVGAVYRRSVRDAVYAAAVVIGSIAGLRWGLAGVAAGVSVSIIINYCLAVRMSLGLVRISVRDVISAQIPGFILGVSVLLTLLPTTIGMRALNAGAIITVLAGAAVSLISLAIALWTRPSMLGRYGIRTLVEIYNAFPPGFIPSVFGRQLEAKLGIQQEPL